MTSAADRRAEPSVLPESSPAVSLAALRAAAKGLDGIAVRTPLRPLPALGRIAGLEFFWLSHLDRVLDRGHSLDSASSVYFLGRKGGPVMTPPQAIEHYQGGM